MPSLIGSLFVSLTADFNGFQRNMQSAEGIVASTSAGMRKHMGLTEKSVGSLQRSMGGNMRPTALIAAGRSFDSAASRANLLRGSVFALTAAFGGLGAALTTNVIARYFDTFTGIENQIRVVAKDSGDLAAQIALVGDVATRSRSSLQAVSTLYARLSKASPGQDPEKILRRVETVNKALQLGGATAQEAASAAIQFSQAIQSNRLGGEELRAVLETPLGGALAKGMGITIAKFREMSLAGQLTADVLNKALDNISGTIDGQFAKSVATIDQSLTNADTAITLYAGRLDDAYGITKLITGGIDGFSNNLETLIPLLTTVGALMGTVFAARRAGGVGQTLLSPVTGIMAIRAARQDSLKMAKEEVEAAKNALAVENQRVDAARKVASGNMRDLGGKSELKAYQKAQADLGKIEKERLAITQQQAEVQRRLADVSVGQAAGAISRDKEAVTLRKQLVALDKQAIANQQQLGTARGGVTATRKALTTSGSQFAAKGLEAAGMAAAQAGAAVALAEQRMTAATRAAGVLRTSIGVLQAGYASLSAFLGGPVGVAFTAITAAVTLLALRSRKAAEEIAEAQALIRAEIEKSGEAPNVTPEERTSLVQMRLIEKAQEIKKVTAELQRVQGELVSGITNNLFASKNFTDVLVEQVDPQATLANLNKMIAGVSNGTVAVADLFEELTRLGVDVSAFEDQAAQAEILRNQIDLANFSLRGMKKVWQELQDTIAASRVSEFSMYPNQTQILGSQYEQLERARRSATTLTNQRTGNRNFREDVLEAAGDTGDKALNSEVKIRRRTEALYEQRREMGMTREEAAALAREELNLAEASRLAAKADKDQTKDLEKLTDKMRELREEADAAFMSEADRAVVNITKKFDNVSPGQEQQIRDSILQKQAAESWREIIRTYGTGAQLTATFSEKQRELNYLVATGRITAGQAGLAWADFIGQFKEHEWIDQTSDALGQFTDSALTDFENIEDAFKNLLKNLAKIIIQEAVTKPLTDWFRSTVSSFVGGGATGGGGGGIGSQIVETIGSKIFGGGGAAQLAGSVGSYTSAITRSAVVEARRAAISSIESGGRYDALGPMTGGDRAYGKYQVMGANIGPWSKETFGKSVSPSEFLASPKIQDAIFDKKIGEYTSRFGDRGAAQAWFGGPGSVGKNARTDVLGTSVGDYGDKYVNQLGEMTTSAKTATDAVTKMAGASGAATEGLGTLGGGLQNMGNALSQFPAAPAAAGGGGWLSKLFGGFGNNSNLFTGAFANFNPLGPMTGLFHSGGTVGASGNKTFSSGDSFATARRYHGGKVRSNEFRAILEKGEEVLTKNQSRRHAGAMSGLTGMAARGGNGTMDLRVSVDGARGNQEIMDMVATGVSQGIQKFKSKEAPAIAIRSVQEYQKRR